MRTLTEAESNLINNTEYTVDWSELSETTSEERLESMFEALVPGHYDERDDLGGLTVYFKNDKLVAFYDYEQFAGTIFKWSWRWEVRKRRYKSMKTLAFLRRFPENMLKDAVRRGKYPIATYGL